MELHALYHDVDRLPYLLLIRDHARRHGLTLHLEEHKRTGKADWAEVLQSEETDLIAESYWRLQRYRADGVPFIALASGNHQLKELLLARPPLRTLQDLRGKRIAVRGTGPQAVFPPVFFRQLGWEDIEFITYSERDAGRWRHWTHVVNGDCDACFVAPLYADEPLAAGLQPIDFPPFAFEGGHVTITTTQGLFERKYEAFTLLVRAMFDASAAVIADEAALDHAVVEASNALAEHFDLSSPERRKRISRLLRDEVWEIPVPTAAGIENARVLAAEQYPQLNHFNPLLMWDFSLARKAMVS